MNRLWLFAFLEDCSAMMHNFRGKRRKANYLISHVNNSLQIGCCLVTFSASMIAFITIKKTSRVYVSIEKVTI